MKFHGEAQQLNDHIQSLGYKCEVKQSGAGLQFKLQNGAILNWFPTTGRINFQGDAAAANALQEAMRPLISGGVSSAAGAVVRKESAIQPVPPAKVEAQGRVFVVHGHDTVAREQLELVLHKLGLEPFVLQNTGGGGLTIIEALEKEIGKQASVKFGIVLLTPDDVGYANSQGPDHAQPRGRQNVVLEMGMLLSSVGRGNVAILQKGKLEVPSDALGILYLSFKDHVKEVVPKLVERLTQAGFVINSENVVKASA